MRCDNMIFNRSLTRPYKLSFLIKKSVGCGSVKNNFRPGPGPNTGQKYILVPVPSRPRRKNFDLGPALASLKEKLQSGSQN